MMDEKMIKEAYAKYTPMPNLGYKIVEYLIIKNKI